MQGDEALDGVGGNHVARLGLGGVAVISASSALGWPAACLLPTLQTSGRRGIARVIGSQIDGAPIASRTIPSP